MEPDTLPHFLPIECYMGIELVKQRTNAQRDLKSWIMTWAGSIFVLSNGAVRDLKRLNKFSLQSSNGWRRLLLSSSQQFFEIPVISKLMRLIVFD